MADIATELSQALSQGHYVMVGAAGRPTKAPRGGGHARTERGKGKRRKARKK